MTIITGWINDHNCDFNEAGFVLFPFQMFKIWARLTRAAAGGSEPSPQTQPASGSAWSELQHTEAPSETQSSSPSSWAGSSRSAPPHVHTVVIDDDGLVLHFGHLHVAVGLVHLLVGLHAEHLCGQSRRAGVRFGAILQRLHSLDQGVRG